MIDINVWLALSWDQHPQHAAAARWYESIDDAEFLFCRFTMLGLLRLLTNRQVMGGSVLAVSGALGLYDRWRLDPRVELAGEPRSAEEHFRHALGRHAAAPATKAIADCYLAGLAEALGARLVTFDRALAGAAKGSNPQAVLLAAVPLPPQRRGR